MAVDNRDYYDEFADWYEDHRHGGYHELIDDLESDLLRQYVIDREVLEVGCGTGLILRRIEPLARRAFGVDLSYGMLEQAAGRGLSVAQADATALPFPDASFDVVCSFKMLAHVPDVREALAEMVRVARPGGHLLAEFYNPMSIRYLAKRLAGPGHISEETTEDEVYTRWDAPDDVQRWIPDGAELVDFAGIRVVTPTALVHDVPWVRFWVRKLEFLARDSPLRYFGGFLVAILRKGV